MTDHSKEFEVQDRRASKQEPGTGEQQDTGAQPKPEPESEPQPSPAAQQQQQAQRRAEGTRAQQMEVDFSTFLVSLATSAYVQMGVAKHPDDPEAAANLPMARQTIDILGLLEEKTRGNLTENEAALLQQLLFDLRMQFVDVSSSQGTGAGKK